jgi:hypothetical protein
MDSNKTTDKIKDRKVILSTLWIFVTFNYLYCDIVGLMDSQLLKQFLTGNVNGLEMNQNFLFTGALLMEIPIAMILLSRILKYRSNRLTNIIAGTIMTTVQLASQLAGTPTLYYIFFSIIEIVCTIVIVWYALKWKITETTNN